MKRTALVALLLVLLAHACFAKAPAESSYPSHPVRFITPFAPGGGTDVVARTVARKLADVWGQPVVVDNRPGASTIIATELAVRSPPDGYTMLLVAASFSTNPSLQKKLPYDPFKDLVTVTQTAFQPYVFAVHPSLPVRSVKEFIAYAQARPGELNFGSPGTQSHLAVELFKMMTQTNMVHVPYRGAALALTDLLAGQIQFIFATTLTVAPHIRFGKLRSLAVTSGRRSSALPDLPTIAEAGVPGFDVSAWNGVMVPARVPAPIVARLNKDIVNALSSPDVRDKLAADGAEPVGGTAEQFARLIRSEIATWAKVVKAAGLRPE